MRFKTLAPTAFRRGEVTGQDLAIAGLFVAVSAAYFVQAINLAAAAPLWMDEVLALWTARSADLTAVLHALEGGSEFTPPLYDSFLYLVVKAGLSSPLMLRLSSVIAGYLAALAMGALVQPRAGWRLAALATALTLCSGLFEYAVQARPYIFVTALFGWVLVVWDRLPIEGTILPGKCLALAGMLTAMVALHFYAVLLVALLGFLEIVRLGGDRRLPRPPVIAAVAVGGMSILLWLPILKAASVFSRQDVFAPLYYARPRLSQLGLLYPWLARWPGLVTLAMLPALMLIRRIRIGDARLAAIAGILCVAPLFIFVFSWFVSHSFAPRYAICGVFGFALLMVWLIAQFEDRAPLLAGAILALLVAETIGRPGGELAKTDRLTMLAVVANAPGALPIVTGSGLRFFEMAANAPPSIARRLVYLDLPAVQSGDPTNRHQVERWKTIDSTLPVVEAGAFICATPRFLLLTDPSGGVDDLPEWLASHAAYSKPSRDRPALTLIEKVSCPTSSR